MNGGAALEQTLSSPLTDEEFFDAIEDLIGSFDEREAHREHNTRQLERIKEISHSNSSSYQSPPQTQPEQPPPYQSSQSSTIAAMYNPAQDTHRYSHKVKSHIEKHIQSLDTTQDDAAGWIEFHKEGDMRMYRRDQETPEGRVIDPLRLFHTIDGVSAYECQHYFWDTQYRLEWEHTIDSFKILEVLDPTTIVLLQDHKRVWPAAKRDAVYLSSLQQIDHQTDDPCYIDTWIVTNFSVEHDSAKAKNDGSVRVFIDVCMICQTFKRDPNGSDQDRNNIFTKIVYISQVDPGGWLPPAALRKVYKNEYPRFLRQFSKYVTKKTQGDKKNVKRTAVMYKKET